MKNFELKENPENLESNINLGCQVIFCSLPAEHKKIEITLEKKDGEEFLFFADFCSPHFRGYSAAPGILADAIMQGRLRGIDPSILKGALNERL